MQLAKADLLPCSISRFAPARYIDGQYSVSKLSVAERQRALSILYNDQLLQVRITKAVQNVYIKGHSESDLRDYVWEILTERIMSGDSAFPIEQSVLSEEPTVSYTYRSFVLQTAKNALIDFRRKQLKSSGDVFTRSLPLQYDDGNLITRDIRVEPSSVDSSEVDAVVDSFNAAVSGLKPSAQRFLIDYIAHRCSTANMAKASGENESTLKTKKRYNLAKLRANIGPVEVGNYDVFALAADRLFSKN